MDCTIALILLISLSMAIGQPLDKKANEPLCRPETQDGYGWIYVEDTKEINGDMYDTGVWFGIFKNGLTFNEAVDACLELESDKQAQLASVLTEKENSRISSSISFPAWIGGAKIGTVWYWLSDNNGGLQKIPTESCNSTASCYENWSDNACSTDDSKTTQSSPDTTQAPTQAPTPAPTPSPTTAPPTT